MKISPAPRRTTADRLTLYGLLVLCCLSVFFYWNSRAVSAQRSDAPQIAVRGDLTQRQLLIGGRVVLEKAGSHFGRPTISPDGRLLAV
ncbi:MAG: hypothetical protein HY328_07305, partial [Chloroflexi bacterium]|nr:hypothetical protein [Chloroflexota bacterium]